jgi:hypoxanthine-DNA glycosylase
MKIQSSFHPFEPIIFDDSRVLILGTFPSIDSFKNEFYYGHKRNQFWKILSNIYNIELNSVEDKLRLLKDKKIALWDMVKSCSRKNSLDSNLKDIEVNDIESLIDRYNSLDTILFTGKKAESLYKKHFSHLEINTQVLPSPSPAYASMKMIEKESIKNRRLV